MVSGGVFADRSKKLNSQVTKRKFKKSGRRSQHYAVAGLQVERVPSSSSFTTIREAII